MRYLMFAAVALAGTANAKEPESPARHPQQESAGPSVELSSGVEYEEGDYGTGRDIRTMSVQSSVRVTAGRFQLAVTLPYKRIDGPANVVTGGGLLGLPIIIDPTTPPGERSRREGVGDLTLGASFAIPTNIVDVTLASEVKLPTASRRLGTGETDYGVGAEISRKLGGVTPFAGVSYTVPGDPDGFSLRNSLSLRGGIAASIGTRARGYISYSQAESVSRTLPDEQQVISGVNAALGDRLSLGVYGAAGLSDGSPDLGAGIRLGFKVK